MHVDWVAVLAVAATGLALAACAAVVRARPKYGWATAGILAALGLASAWKAFPSSGAPTWVVGLAALAAVTAVAALRRVHAGWASLVGSALFLAAVLGTWAVIAGVFGLDGRAALGAGFMGGLAALAAWLAWQQITARRDALLRPGARVAGRYVLRRQLGRGTQAIVYAAQDLQTGTACVLKVLRNGEATARELRSLEVVRSPHVVRVLDAVSTQQGPGLVMELVEGESLAGRLQKGPLLLAEWRSLAVDCLQGMEAVHAAGLVHRDIKPSNILLDHAGRAKLADFGLAREADAQATRTTIGAAEGTALYMSPEQASGRRLGPPSDLYSLGIVLHEALTGRPLVTNSHNDTHIEVQMLRARARRTKLTGVGDPALAAWLSRALEPDASRRYASASQMLAALPA